MATKHSISLLISDPGCDVGPQDDGHERCSSRFCAIFMLNVNFTPKFLSCLSLFSNPLDTNCDSWPNCEDFELRLLDYSSQHGMEYL